MQTVPSTSPCIHVHSVSVIEMIESSSEIAARTVFLTLTLQTLEHCWFPHNWGRGAELTCNVNLNSVHFKQAWLFIKQMKATSCWEAAPEAALGGVWWWAWRHCRPQPGWESSGTQAPGCSFAYSCVWLLSFHFTQIICLPCRSVVIKRINSELFLC